MTTMQIPRHLRWTSEEMAEWLLASGILERPGRVTVFAEDWVPTDFDQHRLTRVPYWMTVVRGSFVCRRFSQDDAVEIGPGDTAMFLPGTYATSIIEPSCEYLRVTVEAEGVLVGRELQESPQIRKGADAPLGTLWATWIPGLLGQPGSGLLERLLVGKTALPVARQQRYAALLWEIFEQLNAAPGTAQAALSRAELILRYLRDACERPLSRERVAEAFGVSAGYLGQLVRETSGKSFQEILLENRLERACWLLRRSGLTVQDVALRSGFTSGNYFAQAFRREFGQNPSTWRQENGI